MALGKAHISTPYWYAAEVLDKQGRGMLVPFETGRHPQQPQSALLANDEAREAMRERAYLYARPMIWKTGSAVLHGRDSSGSRHCKEAGHMRFAVTG